MKKLPLLAVLASASSLALSGCDRGDDQSTTPGPVEETVAKVVEPDPVTARGASAAAGSDSTGEPADPNEAAPEDANYEAWFSKYHLSLEDPGMLDADPDADGFSNRDEFLADTDPTSLESRPGFHRSLRLREYNEVKVPLVLQSIENNQAKIQRADSTGAGDVETVKQGDTIRGTGLKVSKIRQKKEVDKNGVVIDASELVAENTSSGEKIILVKDLAPRSSESYAVLGSGDGGATVKVKQGETFHWPGEPDKTYRVIDLRPTQVVVEQIETGKTFTIPQEK